MVFMCAIGDGVDGVLVGHSLCLKKLEGAVPFLLHAVMHMVSSD